MILSIVSTISTTLSIILILDKFLVSKAIREDIKDLKENSAESRRSDSETLVHLTKINGSVGNTEDKLKILTERVNALVEKVEHKKDK